MATKHIINYNLTKYLFYKPILIVHLYVSCILQVVKVKLDFFNVLGTYLVCVVYVTVDNHCNYWTSSYNNIILYKLLSLFLYKISFPNICSHIKRQHVSFPKFYHAYTIWLNIIIVWQFFAYCNIVRFKITRVPQLCEYVQRRTKLFIEKPGRRLPQLGKNVILKIHHYIIKMSKT